MIRTVAFLLIFLSTPQSLANEYYKNLVSQKRTHPFYIKTLKEGFSKMEKSKEEIIKYVMVGLEGEYDNDPRDNGGETFWGVTKVAWADYTGLEMNQTQWPVPGFNQDMAYGVYSHFWDKMQIDLLPYDMRLMVFSFGFNAGYGKATRFMQDSLGLKVDGIIGPITKASYVALNESSHNETKYSFAENVIQYYFKLDDFDHFGRGWINRLTKSIIYI